MTRGFTISRDDEASLAKAVAVGVAAGLLASAAMDAFQAAWTATSQAGKPKLDSTEEPTTVKAANTVWRATTGRDLPQAYRKPAGTAAHYGLGAALGALYGLAEHLGIDVTRSGGLPFGFATWLALDEILVPRLGLAKHWMETPAATHLYGLVSHLVFGASLEGVRERLSRTLVYNVGT